MIVIYLSLLGQKTIQQVVRHDLLTAPKSTPRIVVVRPGEEEEERNQKEMSCCGGAEEDSYGPPANQAAPPPNANGPGTASPAPLDP